MTKKPEVFTSLKAFAEFNLDHPGRFRTYPHGGKNPCNEVVIPGGQECMLDRTMPLAKIYNGPLAPKETSR